jgi:hypothetical protein
MATTTKKLTDAEKKQRAEQRKADIKSGAKFSQLATRRVNQARKALRMVENTARYPHTPEQGAKVVSALREALTATSAAFDGSKASDDFTV